jgi:hypothetical protein
MRLVACSSGTALGAGPVRAVLGLSGAGWLTVSVAAGLDGAVPGERSTGVLAVSVGPGLGAGVAGSAAGLGAASAGGRGAAPGKLIAGDAGVLTAPDGLIGACPQAVAASDNIAAAVIPPHNCFMPHPPSGRGPGPFAFPATAGPTP